MYMNEKETMALTIEQNNKLLEQNKQLQKENRELREELQRKTDKCTAFRKIAAKYFKALYEVKPHINDVLDIIKLKDGE